MCTGVGTVDERTRARQTRKPWPKQNDGESLMCVSMPAIKVQTLTPSWAAMPCCADRRREVHLVRQLRLSADTFNGFGFNGADFLFVNTVHIVCTDNLRGGTATGYHRSLRKVEYWAELWPAAWRGARRWSTPSAARRTGSPAAPRRPALFPCRPGGKGISARAGTRQPWRSRSRAHSRPTPSRAW